MNLKRETLSYDYKKNYFICWRESFYKFVLLRHCGDIRGFLFLSQSAEKIETLVVLGR